MMSHFFGPKFTLPPSLVTQCHKIHDPPPINDVTNPCTLPPPNLIGLGHIGKNVRRNNILKWSNDHDDDKYQICLEQCVHNLSSWTQIPYHDY